MLRSRIGGAPCSVRFECSAKYSKLPFPRTGFIYKWVDDFTYGSGVGEDGVAQQRQRVAGQFGGVADGDNIQKTKERRELTQMNCLRRFFAVSPFCSRASIPSHLIVNFVYHLVTNPGQGDLLTQ